MSEEKTNFILHDDYVDFLDGLSDEEFGKLIRAISGYSRTGEVPNLPISLSIAFNFIRKRVDDERTKWEETRNARVEAGKKGAEKRWNKNGQTANDSSAINANNENSIPIICHDSEMANDSKNAVSVSVSVSESVIPPPIVPPHGGECARGRDVCACDDVNNIYINNTSNNQEERLKDDELKKAQRVKKQNEAKEQERRFDVFWDTYPLKAGKKKAKIAWNKLKVTDKLLEEILAGLARYRASPQWQKDNGQFIPHPSTFLNQERWKDEVEVDVNSQTNSTEVKDFVDRELEELIQSQGGKK